MEKALILIDLQNDYFPGGKMELLNVDEAGTRAAQLLKFFREKKWPVIHIQHISMQEGAFFFLPETAGAEINSCVSPISEEVVIQKHFPNSFRETTLKDKLNSLGTKELIFCGAMSHMCIDATVRAAFDLEYQCTVAEDACATLDMSFNDTKIPAAHVHGAFMTAFQMVYATVSTVEQLVAATAS